jgi:hypothetical protein
VEVRQPVAKAADDRELRAMRTALDVLEPLDQRERERVLSWLASRLGVEASQSKADQAAATAVNSSTDQRGTVKKYLKEKNPGDDVARATTLAYYLSHAKGITSYKASDLTRVRVEAALPSFNMSTAISHAQRSGYLTTAGKRGLYQVTATGESLVEALPDRAAVRQARAKGMRRRRKSPSEAVKKNREGNG